MRPWTMTPAIAFLFCAALLAPPRAALADDTRGAAAAATELGAKAADDTLDFQTLDELPKPIRKVLPKYPESARARRQEGTVFVRARITEKGATERLSIVPGKGVAADLDKAALDAVRRWKFSPAKKGGKPVAVYIVIPVAFRLH